jgi:hypothetical protein
LERGLSHLIFGKIITKIANLGSKKAGLSSYFWEDSMIKKKEVFYRSDLCRKITANMLHTLSDRHLGYQASINLSWAACLQISCLT